MNRKQKIAIVVGPVVVALLALFPPWVLIKTERYMASMFGAPTGESVKVYAGPRWAFAEIPAAGSFGAPDYTAALSLQLAALALTVAAVILLKDRKPTA